jgi:hypothetical protein
MHRGLPVVSRSENPSHRTRYHASMGSIRQRVPSLHRGMLATIVAFSLGALAFESEAETPLCRALGSVPAGSTQTFRCGAPFGFTVTEASVFIGTGGLWGRGLSASVVPTTVPLPDVVATMEAQAPAAPDAESRAPQVAEGEAQRPRSPTLPSADPEVRDYLRNLPLCAPEEHGWRDGPYPNITACADQGTPGSPLVPFPLPPLPPLDDVPRS